MAEKCNAEECPARVEDAFCEYHYSKLPENFKNLLNRYWQFGVTKKNQSRTALAVMLKAKKVLKENKYSVPMSEVVSNVNTKQNRKRKNAKNSSTMEEVS